MLGKGLCDFISWQLRFRNLFDEKREGGHMRTTQNLLSEKGPAATYENNKAQPVTIGNRLGFE